MKLKYSILFAAVLLMQYGCGHDKKASDPLADSGRTQRTENLLANIDSISANGYLVGQQDATIYGIGWEGDSARSDIKTVSGEDPAIVGFEVGGIERLKVNENDSVVPPHARNINGILFSTIHKRILDQYDNSGVCVVTWHMASRPTWIQIDHLLDFINSLNTPYGVRVPVILCPCTPYQNLNFWQRLTERIKAKNVTNAILACDMKSFTPDMAEYVDILEIADCCKAHASDKAYASRLDKELTQLSQLGSQFHKPVGVLSAGLQGIRTEKWFSTVLQPVLDKHKMSFFMFARNDNSRPGNFYVPFPGQQCVTDFVTFVNAPATLFLHDVNGLYLKKGNEN